MREHYLFSFTERSPVDFSQSRAANRAKTPCSGFYDRLFFFYKKTFLIILFRYSRTQFLSSCRFCEWFRCVFSSESPFRKCTILLLGVLESYHSCVQFCSHIRTRFMLVCSDSRSSQNLCEIFDPSATYRIALLLFYYCTFFRFECSRF